MKYILCFILLFCSNLFAEDFKLSFEWGDLKLCTSGMPNTVENPKFELTNVPDGTKWIYFKMVDLKVPSFNHGGGWIEYIGENTLNPGAFKYKSPCPPDGVHKYQWTATAKSKKSSFGGKIASTSFSKNYP
tara:strand:- start:633 stop:1025 length:393 start_codon:yes stop_codon:yes gene_type:complete